MKHHNCVNFSIDYIELLFIYAMVPLPFSLTTLFILPNTNRGESFEILSTSFARPILLCDCGQVNITLIKSSSLFLYFPLGNFSSYARADKSSQYLNSYAIVSVRRASLSLALLLFTRFVYAVDFEKNFLHGLNIWLVLLFFSGEEYVAGRP